MSAYGLNCTVCKDSFESRESWLTHLLTERHQICARQECIRWRKKEKKCVIVVFSDQSMAHADSLLEYFSMKDLSTIVTDFVWWPDREKMGLMQFESRAKVKEVLQELGKSVLQLPDCFVQLKKATTYLDLEWSQLICKGTVSKALQEKEDRKPKLLRNGAVCLQNGGNPKIRNTYSVAKDNGNHKRPDSLVGSVIEDHGNQKRSNSLTAAVNDDDDIEIIEVEDSEEINGVVQEQILEPDVVEPEEEILVNENKVCDASSENHVPFLERIVDEDFGLAWSRRISEFRDLCKSVEIPDDEYNQFLDILDGVRKIYGPQYEVHMYRNWYLKLRNPGSNILLLHAYGRNNPDDPERFLVAHMDLERELLDTEASRELLPGFKQKWDDENIKCKHGGTLYINPRSGMRFTITGHPLRIVEAQMCRLIEYYCTFSPCVKILLSLVYVWANSNDVHLAQKSIRRHIYHSNVPEPAALDWLVILFLIKENVLPSVRTIQSRTHKPLVMCENRIDIGFKADPKFVVEWNQSHAYTRQLDRYKNVSPKFIKNVLFLLKGFFELLEKIWCGREKWVLNPRDGEICNREEFLSNEPKTKLSDREMSVLREINESLEKDEFTTKDHLIIRKWKIYMINPLYTTWKLSLCHANIRKYGNIIRETLMRISKFQRKYNNPKLLNSKLNLEEALVGSQGMINRKCESNKNLRKAIRIARNRQLLENRKKCDGSKELQQKRPTAKCKKKSLNGNKD